MIDYHIAAYYEAQQLDTLLTFLYKHKGNDDNIVVTLDTPNATQETIEVVHKHNIEPLFHPLNLNQPNGQFDYSKKHCTNKYMFCLCADETPHEFLMGQVANIIATHPQVDAFSFPRMNIFPDLNAETSANMYVGNRPQNYLLSWSKTLEGWLEWPDYQVKLIQNVEYIHYGGATHSGLIGHRKLLKLPADPKYGLYHIKTVEQQSESNRRCDLALGMLND
jgi:hypothetical protein